MTINEYLIKLQEDLEAGKKLSPVEVQQLALDIQNQAKRELTPDYVRLNALQPMLAEIVGRIKNVKAQCEQCAGIMKQMHTKDVASE